MSNRMTPVLMLVLLGGVLASGARAQVPVDSRPRSPFIDSFDTRLRANPGLQGNPQLNVQPLVPQVFPELRAVKRPVRLMPPRRIITLDSATRGDADLSRLQDERRRLVGAMRAAREVGDRRAMMTTMSRLESLRQRRLHRMRALGRSIRPERDGGEGGEPGAAPGTEPVMPLPTLPRPSRG